MPGELRAEAVTVTRAGRAVVDAVDLVAAPGTVTAILGPNGAGKSTLLRALAGVLPCEGRITLDGAPVAALDPRARARLMTYVPQQTGLGAGLDVATVVGQGRYAHTGGLGRPGEADRRALEEAMAKTDVAGLAARRFDRLSAGERRRVLLARALATEAPVILLDEPTAALDVRHALELHALLRRLADEGTTVVVVLHELDAARATDAALLLESGRAVASGPSAEVITAETVERVYGVELVDGGALGFRLPSSSGGAS